MVPEIKINDLMSTSKLVGAAYAWLFDNDEIQV